MRRGQGEKTGWWGAGNGAKSPGGGGDQEGRAVTGGPLPSSDPGFLGL